MNPGALLPSNAQAGTLLSSSFCQHPEDPEVLDVDGGSSFGCRAVDGGSFTKVVSALGHQSMAVAFCHPPPHMLVACSHILAHHPIALLVSANGVKNLHNDGSLRSRIIVTYGPSSNDPGWKQWPYYHFSWSTPSATGHPPATHSCFSPEL